MGTGGLGGGGGTRFDGGTGGYGMGGAAGGGGAQGGTGGVVRFDGGTGGAHPDAETDAADSGNPDRPDAAEVGDATVRMDADALRPMDAPVRMDADASVADTPMVGDTADAAVLDGASETRAVDVGAVAVCGPFANGGSPADAGAAPSPLMSFFVTSLTSVNANLGGLAGADLRCQNLAQAVGLPSPMWRAYLSVEHDPPGTGASLNARDRIGTGPWYNARGALLANNLASLHARPGDPGVFLDEHGNMINGQWTGSPRPVEHDILTGSNPDGTLALGKTCADWTSDSGPSDGGAGDGGTGQVARVGHSDGFGPQCSTSMSPVDYTSWNSAHDNAGCNNTLPFGGAGRIYCFKANQ